MERECPDCSARSVTPAQVLAHLADGAGIVCAACVGRLVMHRRKRWGPFTSGVMHQVLLVGGVTIGGFLGAVSPVVVAVMAMIALESANRWFGPFAGEDTCSPRGPN